MTDTSTTTALPAPPPSAPSFAALFLITFDQKVGYTLKWHRSTSDIDLPASSIEYSSLPSGLHSIREDLIYFLHREVGSRSTSASSTYTANDDEPSERLKSTTSNTPQSSQQTTTFAGLSAFVSRHSPDAAERNAKFVSVGALVRLREGRLGRAWELAAPLQEIARSLVEQDDTAREKVLEEYWSSYSEDAGEASQRPGPGVVKEPGHSRTRALSTLTGIMSGPAPEREFNLPRDHPARSVLEFLDTFGPLVFPLQRLALLRRRILFVAPPPVRRACEFVYILSILSTLPSSLHRLLPDLLPPTLSRLAPLFTITIHDIPLLQSYSPTCPPEAGNEQPLGFLAATTDEILALKPQLWDVLVELPGPLPPPPHIHPLDFPEESDEDVTKVGVKATAGKKLWPKIKLNDGTEIKATGRDVRRWLGLRRDVLRVQGRRRARREYRDDPSEDPSAGARNEGVADACVGNGSDERDAPPPTDGIIEPVSWAHLAYQGFMWWASAGEQDAQRQEEEDLDAELLGEMEEWVGGPDHQAREPPPGTAGKDDAADDEADARLQAGVIAYFHRVAGLMFEGVAGIVGDDGDSSEADAGFDGPGENEEDDDEIPLVEREEKEEIVLDAHDLRHLGLDGWSAADESFVTELVELYWGRRARVAGVGVECCGVRVC